jgi:hypothetical protein
MANQAFLWSYDSAPSRLRSSSCLSFSVFLCVTVRSYWREGGREGVGRSQIIIRPREILALYKSFNTFWSLPYPSHSRIGKEDAYILTPFQKVYSSRGWLVFLARNHNYQNMAQCVCVSADWSRRVGGGGRRMLEWNVIVYVWECALKLIWNLS